MLTFTLQPRAHTQHYHTHTLTLTLTYPPATHFDPAHTRTHPPHKQDGQLAVFMGTAHRQIKGLEETVKELQKM